MSEKKSQNSQSFRLKTKQDEVKTAIDQLNSFHTNASIHDCVYAADSVESTVHKTDK